ncbi:MAG: hypothetical protein D6722_07610 [Bacteroidetes bacterium]|nr:MAG: hypothetical protein D6722_07610 [Bacteroidota bacterium]
MIRDQAQVKFVSSGQPGQLRLKCAQNRYEDVILPVSEVVALYVVRGRVGGCEGSEEKGTIYGKG